MTVLAAAPKFAAASQPEGPLAIQSFSASYGTDNPELLHVAAQVTGGGTAGRMMAASAATILVVDIPAGLFDSVECTTASAITGSRASGFSVEFDTTSGTPFAATLEFGSRTASPWDGFSGPGFGVTLTANSQGEQVSTSSAVPEFTTSVPPLAEMEALGSVEGAVPFRANIEVLPVAVHADYPGVVGGMTLIAYVFRSPDDEEEKPLVAEFSPGWTQTDGGNLDTPTQWAYRFETTQGHHTARTNATYDDMENPDRGPGDWYEFGLILENAGIQAGEDATVELYITGEPTPLQSQSFLLTGMVG